MGPGHPGGSVNIYQPGVKSMVVGRGGGGELLKASFIKLKPNAGGSFGVLRVLLSSTKRDGTDFVDMYEYI